MYNIFGLFLEKLKGKTPFPFFLFSFLFQKTMYCLDAQLLMYGLEGGSHPILKSWWEIEGLVQVI